MACDDMLGDILYMRPICNDETLGFSKLLPLKPPSERFHLTPAKPLDTTGLIWKLPNLGTFLTRKLAKLGNQPLITSSYETVAVTTS